MHWSTYGAAGVFLDYIFLIFSLSASRVFFYANAYRVVT